MPRARDSASRRCWNLTNNDFILVMVVSERRLMVSFGSRSVPEANARGFSVFMICLFDHRRAQTRQCPLRSHLLPERSRELAGTFVPCGSPGLADAEVQPTVSVWRGGVF